MQKDESSNHLSQLIQLDFDAGFAYDEAISRIDVSVATSQLIDGGC